uniref:DNA polymerase processivity factor n=1 Tax=Equid alphaherpesvirus 4 TaxID=10331 RepID=A0A0X9ZAA4_9ALPH|nr:DNA polymerase processivity subunit [Equid alphaherpesvirus 4]AMB16451.1 DNA polymerase processivity subunit [Equid alphaherpesvirus 4]
MALPRTMRSGGSHPNNFLLNALPAIDNPVERQRAMAVFERESLRDALEMLTPIAPSLKNAFLIFNEDGLLIHTSVGGEQVYIPIQTNNMASYSWQEAPPAVFLANVDGRRGLLDAFRTKAQPTVSKVVFEIENASPTRILTQTVFSTSDQMEDDMDMGSDPENTTQAILTKLVKHEFNNYSLMLPTRKPDVSMSLSKQQLNKILGVCKQANEPITFQCLFDDTLQVRSGDRQVVFSVDYQNATKCGMESSSSLLEKMPLKTKKTAPEPIRGISGRKLFTLLLEEDTNFKQLIQKLKLKNAGAVLNFFLEPESIPMIGLSTKQPFSVMMFFMCSYPQQPCKVGFSHSAFSPNSLGVGLKRRASDEDDSNSPPKKLSPDKKLFKTNFVLLMDKNGAKIPCPEAPINFS